MKYLMDSTLNKPTSIYFINFKHLKIYANRFQHNNNNVIYTMLWYNRFLWIFGRWKHLRIVNKINHKKKNRKNRKIDFSFVSAHCASFIKIWTFLRGRSAYPYLGQGLFFLHFWSVKTLENCEQNYYKFEKIKIVSFVSEHCAIF